MSDQLISRGGFSLSGRQILRNDKRYRLQSFKFMIHVVFVSRRGVPTAKHWFSVRSNFEHIVLYGLLSFTGFYRKRKIIGSRLLADFLYPRRLQEVSWSRAELPPEMLPPKRRSRSLHSQPQLRAWRKCSDNSW